MTKLPAHQLPGVQTPFVRHPPESQQLLHRRPNQWQTYWTLTMLLLSHLQRQKRLFPFLPPLQSVSMVGHLISSKVQRYLYSTDDDFGDLQAAPTAAPAASVANQNLMSLLNATPARATGSAAPTGFVQSQPQTGFGMGGVGHRQTPSLSAQFSSPIPAQSPPVMQPQSFSTGGPLKPTQPSMGFGMGGATMGGGTTLGGTPAARPQSAAASTAKSSNFDDLWSLGLGSAAKPVSTNNTGTGGKSIKDLEKEKAQAGLWGNQAKPPPGAKQFGAFGNLGTAPPPSSSAGNDDFLL